MNYRTLMFFLKTPLKQNCQKGANNSKLQPAAFTGTTFYHRNSSHNSSFQLDLQVIQNLKRTKLLENVFSTILCATQTKFKISCFVLNRKQLCKSPDIAKSGLEK